MNNQLKETRPESQLELLVTKFNTANEELCKRITMLGSSAITLCGSDITSPPPTPEPSNDSGVIGNLISELQKLEASIYILDQLSIFYNHRIG